MQGVYCANNEEMVRSMTTSDIIKLNVIIYD